jgi:hypothetical protein
VTTGEDDGFGSLHLLWLYISLPASVLFDGAYLVMAYFAAGRYKYTSLFQ